MVELQRLKGFNVANHFEKRGLLIAINSIAALSIFFFGYDQGMMGGVNTARDYVDLMGFGHVEDDGTVVITDSLLQGMYALRILKFSTTSNSHHAIYCRRHRLCILSRDTLRVPPWWLGRRQGWSN